MTTYTWPDTRAFQPQAQELRVVDNTQRTAESSLSGYVQTSAMPGTRWGWGLDMAPDTQADRAALEAFLLRLSGRQHRVRVWDIKNPKPRGDIATAGVTLGAAAAQFATVLTLAGCRRVGNLLQGGSMEIDSNADGLADGFTVYSTGTFGTITHSLVAGPMVPGSYGATYQRVQSTGLNGRIGLYPAALPAVAGRTYALTADTIATVSATVELYLQFFDSGAALLAETLQSFAPGLARRGITATAPAGTATVQVYVIAQNTTGVFTLLDVDNIQLEESGALGGFRGPATLLAGDWLGLTGGQLVRVVADATANDAGAMTVEVRHMLRAAVASGTAVTLDKPTALFVRTEAGIMLPRMAGNYEPGVSLDLVEVFA